VFKVKRLIYLVFFALTLQSSLVLADVYPENTFGIHKLCISNPWNGTNYKGDAASAFPCHYDYAIVHVPTLLAEQNAQNNQILNAKMVVKLEIDPVDVEVFLSAFSYGFEFGLLSLIVVWLLGVFLRFAVKAMLGH
jgi:hypothetical protein